MDVCCVVVTYNRKELLLECINSLLNQTYNLKKIIIIDNNSTDGTEEFLNENGIIDIEQVEYNKLSNNIGGAGGFNEGIKSSLKDKYDWVWIMDDDTIPKEDALENLIESLKYINEEVGFLCSKVIGPEKEEMNLPNISRRIGENGYGVWMKYLNKSIVEVESATFVSVLINYNAIKKIGLPWKEFFIWGDDIEYTSRISRYYAPGFAVGTSIALHKRINAKNISIIEENNINRINFYKYKYRNDILIQSSYGTLKSKISLLMKSLGDINKVMFGECKYKSIKLNIIIKSILNGLFNYKIRKSYNKRMDF